MPITKKIVKKRTERPKNSRQPKVNPVLQDLADVKVKLAKQKNNNINDKQSPYSPVKLFFEGGEVSVLPGDQNIFLMHCVRVNDACRNAIKQQERVSKFKTELLIPLRKWCEKHGDAIHSCYISPSETLGIDFHVVGSKVAYDFSLTNSMSDLAIDFFKKGWLIHPSQFGKSTDEELADFFNLNQALVVFGK